MYRAHCLPVICWPFLILFPHLSGMEETLLETESMQRRDEIAAYLRQLADNLENSGPVTVTAGDQDVELTVPNQAEFEISVEREHEDDETETSIELEIEWTDAAQE